MPESARGANPRPVFHLRDLNCPIESWQSCHIHAGSVIADEGSRRNLEWGSI